MTAGIVALLVTAPLLHQGVDVNLPSLTEKDERDSYRNHHLRPPRRRRAIDERVEE